MEKPVSFVNQEKDCWIKPILQYVSDGILPIEGNKVVLTGWQTVQNILSETFVEMSRTQCNS